MECPYRCRLTSKTEALAQVGYLSVCSLANSHLELAKPEAVTRYLQTTAEVSKEENKLFSRQAPRRYCGAVVCAQAGTQVWAESNTVLTLVARTPCKENVGAWLGELDP